MKYIYFEIMRLSTLWFIHLLNLISSGVLFFFQIYKQSNKNTISWVNEKLQSLQIKKWNWLLFIYNLIFIDCNTITLDHLLIQQLLISLPFLLLKIWIYSWSTVRHLHKISMYTCPRVAFQQDCCLKIRQVDHIIILMP